MTHVDKKIRYFDNNATTAVDPEVREAMMPFLTDQYGNPSSMHSFGGSVEKYITQAREQVADLLGAEPTEIVFTSCGTESDNAALLSALETQPHKRHIITTKVEHPAVYEYAEYCERKGYRLTRLPVDEYGLLDERLYEKSLSTETAICSVMYANNETGVIFPIEKLASMAKERGIMFHTDAVQAVGKIPLDMKGSAIDMLSVSGHKLHAPKGVGAVYVRKGTQFSPFFIGGHQERGRRAGTENVASIVALGKACELAKKHMDDENTRVKDLRDRLEREILKICPDTHVNGHREYRLPNTSNISFKFVEGEAILLHFNEYGICASSGSACTSGSLEPSRILRSMGLPYASTHGAIRFSLSRYNTDDDVDAVLKTVPPIIEELRRISPFNENNVYTLK